MAKDDALTTVGGLVSKHIEQKSGSGFDHDDGSGLPGIEHIRRRNTWESRTDKRKPNP